MKSDDLLCALKHELAGWGPEHTFGGIRLYLNAKIRVWIFHDDLKNELGMELYQRRPRFQNANQGVVWSCPLEDPTCIEQLIVFLRTLPDRLAEIDPIWAIDPFTGQ